MPNSNAMSNKFLKPLDHWSNRQSTRPENLQNQLLLVQRDVGSRQWYFLMRHILRLSAQSAFKHNPLRKRITHKSGVSSIRPARSLADGSSAHARSVHQQAL